MSLDRSEEENIGGGGYNICGVHHTHILIIKLVPLLQHVTGAVGGVVPALQAPEMVGHSIEVKPETRSLEFDSQYIILQIGHIIYCQAQSPNPNPSQRT